MRDMVQTSFAPSATRLMRKAAAFILLVCIASLPLVPGCWAASQSRDNCRDKGYDADGTIQACTDLLQKRSWDSFVHLHVRSKAWLAKQDCERALTDENESIRLFLNDPLVARKKMSGEDRRFFRMHGFLGKIEIYLTCFLDYDKALSVVEEAMATDFGASLVRFDLRDLAARNAAVARAAKKRIDATFRRYIAAGTADGSIRPCDPKLAAFAIAGALNWIGHWYQRGGELSPTEIADEFTVRLTEGLATESRQQITKKTPRAPQRRNSGRKTAGKKRTGGGTR